MPKFTVPPNFTGTAGDDTLLGEEFDASPAIGIDVLTGGFISTGSEKDTIIGTANGSNVGGGGSAGGAGTGISNSGSINSGIGNDSLIGTGYGGYSDISFGGDGIGISNKGTIDGDAGNDEIVGKGRGGEGGTYREDAYDGGTGIGIVNTFNINGGTGDDLISGIGKGVAGAFVGGIYNYYGSGGDGIGISNSANVSGGDGNDVIKGIGLHSVSTSSGGRGIGISNTGLINAGLGQDVINGYGTTVGIEGNGLDVVGIDGGAGNDLFQAWIITGLGENGDKDKSAYQDGVVSNIFISGGDGNDTFDLGFGRARLDGGQDYDTLILPVLGSGTYTIGTPDVKGWFQITNNVSTSVFSVTSIEHIVSGGVTLI